MSTPEVQRDLVELMKLVSRNRYLKPRDIPRTELAATQMLINTVREYPIRLSVQSARLDK